MFKYEALKPKGIMSERKGDRVPPGAMDEKNRTLSIADALRKAGLDQAADLLDKVIIPDPAKTGWENKPVSSVLRDAGLEDAAQIADAMENPVVAHMDMGEAGAEGEPHPLTAAQVDAGYDQAFAPTPDGEPGEATTVFSRAMSFMVEGFKKLKEPITEAVIGEAQKAVAAEAGVTLPPEALFAPGEDPFEGTTIDQKSVEVQSLAAIEGMKQEMQSAVEETGKALAEGNVDKATGIAQNLFNRMEAAGVKEMPKEVQEMYTGVKDNLTAAIKEKDPKAKSLLFKFACGAADFIPVVGPAKMLIEAAAGKTLGGDELKGWKRFLHGAEGLVFLAVDCTGFGAVGTKLAKAGKSGAMAAKLMTRSAALMRVLKVPRKVYGPVFTAGRFLVRHPRLGAIATRGMMSIIKGRKLRLVKELPGMLKPKAGETAQPDDITPEMVANPTRREGAELEATPPDYDIEVGAQAAA